GHQVRRELHASRVEPDDDPERLDELRLGEAGNAEQKPVAAGEQHGQAQVDDASLPHDDRTDLAARSGDAFENGVDVAGESLKVRGARRAHAAFLFATQPLAVSLSRRSHYIDRVPA